MQTNYIVEAYVPEYGWYPIESTMGRSPWPNFQQALVAIVPSRYEDQAKAGARVGVPYLSLTELPAMTGHVSPSARLTVRGVAITSVKRYAAWKAQASSGS